MAFVAGVFLSNFPEAMSSSIELKKNGIKAGLILIMWSSLCLITGLGAAFGAVLFEEDPRGNEFYLTKGIEGIHALLASPTSLVHLNQ